jgi:hypothetical protein
MLQCFQLEHPENEMVLCDRPKCEAIADYLEVELAGTEHRLCALHTMSDKYASRLPSRAPDPNTPTAHSASSKLLIPANQLWNWREPALEWC